MDAGKNAGFTRVVGAVAVALVFLLPVKFGGLAVMPESGGFYPEDLFSWLFVNFPPHALGIAGGLLLFMTLAAVRRAPVSRESARLLAVWCLLPPLAALPGLFRGMPDESLGELANLLGIGAFGAVAGLLCAADPAWGRRFAAAFLWGALAAAAYGLHQRFFGLTELREFAARQAAAGVELPEPLRAKLEDPRIFGTMASCNALTSLMLMAIPPAVFFAVKWAERFAPVRVSRRLFAGVFLTLIAANLVFAASRSALVCPVAAVLLAALSAPRLSGRLRAAAALTAALVLAAGTLFALRYGRGLDSMRERADYLRSSAVLAAAHPLAGSGWGGFFRGHMTLKRTDRVEAARDPHNVVAAFASQAGLPAGAAMLAVLLYPLILLWPRRFAPDLSGAVFWTGVLFTLHSLMDCDWHVPALPAAMGTLYFAALTEVPTEAAPPFRRSGALKLVLLALGVAALWTNCRYLRGDRALARINDLLTPASAGQRDAVALWEAPALFREARRRRPGSPTIAHLEGDWHCRRGDFAAAERCYREAATLDPARPGAWAALARLAAWRGDRELAEKLLERARRIYPRNPKYRHLSR